MHANIAPQLTKNRGTALLYMLKERAGTTFLLLVDQHVTRYGETGVGGRIQARAAQGHRETCL